VRTDTDKEYSDCYGKKMAELTAAFRTTNKLTATPYNAEASKGLWETGCMNFFPDKKPLNKEDLTNSVKAT
jgi:hypothetical protein